MTTDHPRDLVGKARIRVFSLADPNLVLDEGDVIAYDDGPSLILRHADGTHGSWSVRLRREVVGPFGAEPVTSTPAEPREPDEVLLTVDSGPVSRDTLELIAAAMGGGIRSREIHPVFIEDDPGDFLPRGRVLRESDVRAAYERGKAEGRATNRAYEEGIYDAGIAEGLRQATEGVGHLRRPFFFTEPANGVTLAVTYQGSDGLAFVAQPHRDASEPYEQYGVVLPPAVARQLALRMLASVGPWEPAVEQPEPERGVGWRLARDEEIQDAAHMAAMEQRHQHEADEKPEGSDRG